MFQPPVVHFLIVIQLRYKWIRAASWIYLRVSCRQFTWTNARNDICNCNVELNPLNNLCPYFVAAEFQFYWCTLRINNGFESWIWYMTLNYSSILFVLMNLLNNLQRKYLISRLMDDFVLFSHNFYFYLKLHRIPELLLHYIIKLNTQ